MVGRALILTLVFAAVPLAEAQVCAADERSATLVIEKAAGDTRSLCVDVDAGETTVLNLLERSGVAVRYQDFGGGNVMICQIDGVGCDYPRRSCTCAFEGERVFWGLYLREQDRWTFSQTGAATTKVRAGAVVGWRWGAHEGENDPPAYDASKRCEAAKTVAVTATPDRSLGALVIVVALIFLLAGTAFAVRARRRTAEVAR